MKKKNIFYVLFIVLTLFVVSSCSIFDLGSDTSTTQSTTENSNITYGANEKVTINESTTTHTASSIEEAVGMVYDSVVAIYSTDSSSTSSGSGVISAIQNN